MDYSEIKRHLVKKKLTLSGIAKELDLCGPQAIHNVLMRRYLSAHIERYVATKLELPLHELFPDRYDSKERIIGGRLEKACKAKIPLDRENSGRLGRVQWVRLGN